MPLTLQYRLKKELPPIMFKGCVNQRKVREHALSVLLLILWMTSMPLSAAIQSAAENRHQAVLRELELTPAEEKDFWPLCECYS